MEKKMIVVGELGVGGQKGRVVYRGGCATSLTATDYKDPPKVVKRWKKR